MRPRQPFVEYALCAIGGILAADFWAERAPILWPWAASVALGAFVLNAFFLHRSSWTLFTLVVGFFALHSFWQTAGPARQLANQIPETGRALHAVGVVLEEPHASETATARFPVRLESYTLGVGGDSPVKTRAKILVSWNGPLPAYGDRVEMDGNVFPIAGARNPGEFDQSTYRRRQGIYSLLSVRDVRDVRILAHDCGNPFIAFSNRLRHWMERTMERDLEDSPNIAALTQSMVLGSQVEMPSEMKQLFRYTGTLHLFAVSGLNVAMLASIVLALLQIFQVPRRWILIMLIPILWIYCLVTGLTPSSMRATLMASIVFFGLAIDRVGLGWNTLGATAFFLLAWDPNQLFMVGFQLSFLMVAVLLSTSRLSRRLVKPLGRPDPWLPRVLWSRFQRVRYKICREIGGAFLVSTFAWLGSMPLMVYYFHLWSPATVPANLVAVPLAWLMLVLAICSMASGFWWHGLSVIFNNANWLVAKIFLSILSALSSIPGAHCYVAMPALAPTATCEIEVLDLRGGAAIHLRASGTDWLIDCGSQRAFPNTVLPWLHSQGVNQLSGFAITHGDAQHIGGGLELLQETPPAIVLDSPLRDRSPTRRKLQEALAAAHRERTLVQRGDTVPLSPNVTLRVLFPPDPAHYTARLADDKALIFRLDVGKTRLLFVSDSGFIGEHWLLEHSAAEELRSDILIKGKHNKDLSGTPEFLTAVRPKLLITSATSFPPEEQIDEEWAEMVQQQGIRLLRQDQTGAVHLRVHTDGTWSAKTFLKH